ncbi:hypothetical protein D1BOALGB6SA_8783 [Olavius sp. associated proteobacterium Delta 1]|nr:hypothetical protein D1BOALGB6SA_8783 [Olavius sp. associated proteobacterium Delta 1]
MKDQLPANQTYVTTVFASIPAKKIEAEQQTFSVIAKGWRVNHTFY